MSITPRIGLLFSTMTLAAIVLASCTTHDSGYSPPSVSAAPASASAQASAKPANPDQPPPPMREFRGAWVATVGNIDWPTKPGLSTAEQQHEAIQILDRARALNLNAIILQVRTTADALYDSKLEPWSAFLTGTQGQAPNPYYDPLKFWIDEAHKRGIELHAWFNPYRTKYGGSKVVACDTHISKTHPELVKSYGQYGWMDPGNPAAEQHSFDVFMDVVNRYDVDGIHIDDYFYPYPELAHPKDKNDTTILPFPDDDSYHKYQAGGGKLDRDDWRRDNINNLIHRVYEGIKSRKKDVKFGISPFGIPRPGLPGIEYVKGFDQYEKLYADTAMWLREGWCDYFAPQLYWHIGAPHQPYLGLIQWWANNNPKHRNIYGGLFTSRIDWAANSWCPDEINGQIELTRLTPGAGGNIHFSMVALDQNRKLIGDDLRDGLYSESALVPASPWLDSTSPPAPTDVTARLLLRPATQPTEPDKTGPHEAAVGAATRPFYPLTPVEEKHPELAQVSWKPAFGKPVWLWAVQYKIGDDWPLQTVPGDQTEVTIHANSTELISRVAVSSVDRCGNKSPAVVSKVTKTK